MGKTLHKTCDIRRLLPPRCHAQNGTDRKITLWYPFGLSVSRWYGDDCDATLIRRSRWSFNGDRELVEILAINWEITRYLCLIAEIWDLQNLLIARKLAEILAESWDSTTISIFYWRVFYWLFVIKLLYCYEDERRTLR